MSERERELRVGDEVWVKGKVVRSSGVKVEVEIGRPFKPLWCNAAALSPERSETRLREATGCLLCDEGMPLKKFLDGSVRHFDGLMTWHPCSRTGKSVTEQSGGPNHHGEY